MILKLGNLWLIAQEIVKIHLLLLSANVFYVEIVQSIFKIEPMVFHWYDFIFWAIVSLVNKCTIYIVQYSDDLLLQVVFAKILLGIYCS